MKYQPYLIVFTDGKLNCTAPRDRVGRSLCTASVLLSLHTMGRLVCYRVYTIGQLMYY